VRDGLGFELGCKVAAPLFDPDNIFSHHSSGADPDLGYSYHSKAALSANAFRNKVTVS